MAVDTKATTFVTGAAGFIGEELVKLLVDRGHRVLGLVDSGEAAARIRQAGAEAVTGNLLQPGPWQDEATADWIFHLVPHSIDGTRVTRRRAASMTRAQVSMDAHLLDAVAGGTTQRIVYVADTSCYGPTGPRAITEDTPPDPSAWGRSLTGALQRLDGYIVSGQPIVAAFPGWVFGNGGWFRHHVIEPVMSGRRVVMLGNGDSWLSPIHVHDCARALVHLAEHGERGSRYFLVNRDAVQLDEFADTFARLVNRPLRVLRLPPFVTRLVVGPVLADHFLTNAIYSNIRLRGIGFPFLYPTLEQGLQQVAEVLHE
jgi:nucleoside-diphosphate-sugar epimerase